MKEQKQNRKRRNCYDRMRAHYLAGIRARRASPASSAATQLLSIFAIIFGRLPSLTPTSATSYARYSPPNLSPVSKKRVDMARRLGVPTRYLDFALTHGHVPYSVLFNHIRQGGVLRRDAMVELRKRVPEAALDWLVEIEKRGNWTDLIRCYSPKEVEDQTNVRMLDATLAWLKALKDRNPLTSPFPSAPNLEQPSPDDDTDKPKL